MNKILNINRLNQLIIRHLVYNLKSITLFYIVFSIIMFIVFFLVSLISKEINFEKQYSTFFFWYILLGAYSSSRAFSETHETGKTYQYLTLPVSNLERFLSITIIYYIFFLLAGILIFLFISFMANSLIASVINQPFKFLDFAPLKFIETSGSYLWLFSIFMAGSISFKRHPFLKTVFALVIFFILISIISAIIFKIIFLDVDLRKINFYTNDFNLFANFKYSVNKTFSIIISILYLILIWLFTYFKLQEKEI